MSWWRHRSFTIERDIQLIPIDRWFGMIFISFIAPRNIQFFYIEENVYICI